MRKLLLLAYLFINTAVKAQPFIDVATVQYGNCGISDLYKGEDEWRIKNDWLNASLTLPFNIGMHDYLVVNPEYNRKIFYDGVSNHIYGNSGNVSIEGTTKYESTYQSILLPVSYLHTLSDTTKNIVFCYIYRQNYSDILKLGWTTDQHGGAIIYSNSASSKFTWKAGLYYNREFYGNYFLPLLGFEWKPNEKIYCWGLLPNNTSIDYTIVAPLHIGFAYQGVEESYAEGYNDYFHLTEGQIQLYSNYYIPHTPLVLSFEAGQTAARTFEYFRVTPNGDATTKTHPSEGFFIRGGIALRVVTDKRFRTRL
jgi:hypothetical protein